MVAFYLLPEFNAQLLPRLLKLKPGTRIVSHDGGIGGLSRVEFLLRLVLEPRPRSARGFASLNGANAGSIPHHADCTCPESPEDSPR